MDTFFRDLNGDLSDVVIGEKRTSCIEYDFMLVRDKTFFLQAKCLIILINPTGQALSNYFFSSKNGLETRSL
jgi:hypothetical protein